MARRKTSKARKSRTSGLELVQVSGVWYVQGTLHGQRVRRSTGLSDRSAALAILEETEKRMTAAHTGTEGDIVTYGELSQRYRKDRQWLAYPLYDAIEKHLWSVRVARITGPTMVALCDALRPGGSVLTRVRNIYCPVRAVIKYGNEQLGVCGPPMFKTPRLPKRDRKVQQWASDEWIAKALDACAAGQGSERLLAMILLLTTTGVRVGEACTLRRADVDWKRGEYYKKTKTGLFLVAIPPEVLAIMDRSGSHEGRLLGFASRHSVNQALERLCARAGIEYLSSHKVGRHAFATRWLKNGGTLKELQVAGRWASIEMPSQIYGHLEMDDVRGKINDSASVLMGKVKK